MQNKEKALRDQIRIGVPNRCIRRSILLKLTALLAAERRRTTEDAPRSGMKSVGGR